MPLIHEGAATEFIEIENTKFGGVVDQGDQLNFLCDTKEFTILRSIFDYPVRFRASVESILSFSKNDFNHYVDFVNFKFPEFNCYLPFSQFHAPLIANFYDSQLGWQILGDSIQDLKDEMVFNTLTDIHKRLYNNYRSRGELSSANAAYLRVKELEISHLKQQESRTAEESMRLRLNQLMGFYTDHSTSPGKAILISFYLILTFGIFYFFFPSEWDKDTKLKMIEDYRLFIRKNEHGYRKPFFKLLLGFLLSFINAMMLSVNSFVTLGFGTIPTQGLARYVCVLQGLFGWFLLSLFTVALINQVLL